MTVEPMSPTEVAQVQGTGQHIPDFVFKAVNKLLVKYNKGGYATFKLKELIDLIIEDNPGQLDTSDRAIGNFRAKLTENRWLDFEPAYRAKGWSVEYDSPAWDESYDPYFKFKKLRT